MATKREGRLDSELMTFSRHNLVIQCSSLNISEIASSRITKPKGSLLEKRNILNIITNRTIVGFRSLGLSLEYCSISSQILKAILNNKDFLLFCQIIIFFGTFKNLLSPSAMILLVNKHLFYSFFLLTHDLHRHTLEV